MYSEFRDKVAFITGGAGVLGSVVATALAEAGCRVAIGDLDGEKADSVARGLETEHPGLCMGCRCDVVSEDPMESARQAVEARFGPVDFLVNAAGGNMAAATTSIEQLDADFDSLEGSFFSLGLDGFRNALDLNLLGTVLPSQVFGRGMAERGSGSIVNIASMNAYRPLTRIPAYSTAKCAVKNFTEWLSTHLARTGVRVNAVAPGFFLTEQLRYLAFDERGELTQRYRKVMANTPMGRFGEPSELVGAFLFLLSEQASFITGATIPVDGGYSSFGGV